MLRITIPTPCHESWDEMKPLERGAFCNACSKQVVDFTQYSNEEIRQYFLENAGKNTCGRFRIPSEPVSDEAILRHVFFSNVSLLKKIAAAVVILFGGLLCSCTQSKQDNKNDHVRFTTGILLTDPAPQASADTLRLPQKPSCTPGEPFLLIDSVYPAYITGDIAIDPDPVPMTQPVEPGPVPVISLTDSSVIKKSNCDDSVTILIP